MSEADFTPLFDGHCQADEQYNIDEQIDAMFFQIDYCEAYWDARIALEDLDPYPSGFDLLVQKLREQSILRSVIAVLTRARAAALAADRGA